MITIKNMVCRRCLWAVEEVFRQQGIALRSLSLGQAEPEEELSPEQLAALGEALGALGFELLSDRRSRLVERIKAAIIELVQRPEGLPALRLSSYLSERLASDYSALSKLFSEVEGITIEHYYILQRIERVKELIVYDELSISEIAYRMGYSSAAYLSSQFKRITGMSPRAFRELRAAPRRPLDEV